MFKFLNFILRLVTFLVVVVIIVVGVNFWVLTAAKSDIYTGNDSASLSADGLVIYLPEDKWDSDMEHKLQYVKQVMMGKKIETIYIFGTPKTVLNTEAFLEENKIDVNLVTNTHGLNVYEMVYALDKKVQTDVSTLVFVDQDNRLSRTVYEAKKFGLRPTGVRAEQMKQGNWIDVGVESVVTVWDFVVVNIFKYEPSKLK